MTRNVTMMLLVTIGASGAAVAQDMSMPGMAMPAARAAGAAAESRATPDGGQGAWHAMPRMEHEIHAAPSPDGEASRHDAMAGTDRSAMAGMKHDSMDGMAMMPAMLGSYAMTREASGTSWQPDSSPMRMVMKIPAGDWSLMAMGNITGVYDNQGGGRGDTKGFSESMVMLMGNRKIGEHGTLGLRAMLSLDALMGKRGYPLLFATGETADGRTSLVDRQHPHDLFMELAASYAYDLGGGRAMSIYAGLPGEPALGPPAFMHRVSGMAIPEAPIDHHWFDSTHITFGVVTLGYSTNHWKLEASAFKGREPDQHRYNFDTPKLDSWSIRGFWNPTANLSLQLSTGHLHSAEQLHPEQNEQRSTASATYNRPLGRDGNWATTLAYSSKDLKPGPALHAVLAESTVRIDPRNTVFGRYERKQDNELFENQPLSPLNEQTLSVNKLSLGYFRTLPFLKNVQLDLGGLMSAYAYPERLKSAYGDRGIKSFMLFARVKLGS